MGFENLIYVNKRGLVRFLNVLKLMSSIFLGEYLYILKVNELLGNLLVIFLL